MKEKRDNGGAAFPIVHPNPLVREPYIQDRGMSLRDYFAAAALNGFLSDAESIAELRGSLGPSAVAEGLAAACFQFADAMLAER